MSKTKIVVIQLKEIIYTALFVGLGILLILLLVFMFAPKSKTVDAPEQSKYIAGVYTSMMELNDTALNMEVVVDENHIKSIQLVNVEESVATMYPLLTPSLEEITKQLQNDVALENLKLSNDSKYTQSLLIDAIRTTLAKAEIKDSNK